MSYLDQLGETFRDGKGGDMNFFVPGELQPWSYPALREDSLVEEAEFWLPKQYSVKKDGSKNSGPWILEFIRTNQDVKKAIYKSLLGSENHCRNYRWQYKYRKLCLEYFLAEGTNFSRELINARKSQYKKVSDNLVTIQVDDNGVVDHNTFVDFFLQNLALRSNHTLVLSKTGLDKIPLKHCVSYVVLFTNFVFNESTILRMKSILKGSGEPHYSWKDQFLEFELEPTSGDEDPRLHFQEYKPFLESTNDWLEKDCNLIQNAFLRPQAILYDGLMNHLVSIKVSTMISRNNATITKTKTISNL